MVYYAYFNFILCAKYLSNPAIRIGEDQLDTARESQVKNWINCIKTVIVV